MRSFIVFLTITLAPCAAAGQEIKSAANAEALAELAANARRKADVPAIGIAVMSANGEPQIAVDGLRLAGTNTRVAPTDAWHWGSITKSMTATLVARLVEKGVVSWDDTIGRLLIDKAPKMRDEYRDVTFVHLLSHRSGLQPNIPILLFGTFAAEPSDRIADRLRWVRIALKQEPSGSKEATYAYSNNGYIVVGAMLEAATGKPWEELMRTEVFDPLGLKSAGFGPPRGETPDAQPRGHKSTGGKDTPVPPGADNPPALGPAGRVHMTLGDMLVYLNAHATKRKDFLSDASYERLHTRPYGGIYALGWIAPGGDGRFHNGSNTMWYGEVGFNKRSGTVAAVVVNDGDIEGVQPTVRELLGSLLDRSE